MTVKQRLSRSNILMIVLPIVISLALTVLLMYLSNLDGGGQTSADGMDSYARAVTKLQESHELWSKENSLAVIEADLSTFAFAQTDPPLSISVYRDGAQVYMQGNTPNTQTDNDIALDEEYAVIHQEYQQKSGEYTIVLSHSYRWAQQRAPDMRLLLFWLVALCMIVAIVLLVNFFLTRHVVRHIVDPLNTLIDGVHELRDGNLEYRIAYQGKDEFAQVCHDFNEMAQQLSDLMQARKRDDENRRELIAGISHDLRTPLTSIKAYVEGIQEGVANTPALQAEYLDIVKAKADDLEHIVRQLFQYSKLDTGAFPFKMENIDIGKDLDQYLLQVEDEYRRKGLMLSLGENTKSSIVVADSVQLHMVFTNVLENAVKYGAADDKRMIIRCYTENECAHLLFRDNGPGVDEAALEKLFNAFYRNDQSRQNPGKGSGLGLAISSKIIEHFGGTIRAENAGVGGLCIHITLPIVGGPSGEQNTDHRG